MKYSLCFFFIIFIISCDKNTICSDYKVIAHRGYWKMADGADNSIMSLREAVRLGADGVELDVRKSKDDSLLVLHDEYHGRFYVLETEYDDIKTVKLSNGEEVSTFRNYLQEAIRYDIDYFIDIKSVGIASKLLQLLSYYNFQNKVKFVSLDPNICDSLLIIAPAAYVAYSGGNKSPREVKQLGYSAVHYEINVWKNHLDWIKEAKSLGMDVAAWIVKTESDIIWCATHGIDYLIADNPLEAIHFRSNYE